MERLTVTELVAMFGGLLLGACLFASWYSAVSPLATLAGETGVGSYSGWQAHPILRWPLLVMAVAPFVLAYIVVREHQLTSARGELTAVLSIFAFGACCTSASSAAQVSRPGRSSSRGAGTARCSAPPSCSPGLRCAQARPNAAASPRARSDLPETTRTQRGTTCCSVQTVASIKEA
jgi:hypothetical protein